MLKTTSLKINAVSPSGDDISTSISNANPEATDVVLENFAKALNNLTQNTYTSTLRIDTTVLKSLTD